jgi:hypothetical protein
MSLFSVAVQLDWGWGPVISIAPKRVPAQPQAAAAAAPATDEKQQQGKGEQDEQQQQVAVKEAAAAVVENPAEMYVVDVLLPCINGSVEAGNPQPGKLGDPGSIPVVREHLLRIDVHVQGMKRHAV